MKTPPLLMAAALAIWAWQTGFWFFGILIALILEASRLIETRWNFSLSDFKRIADSCTIIFVIMAVYLMFSTSPSKIIFTLLQWLPISFFPLIFAQTYSVKNRIDIRVLSLVSRRQKDFGPKNPSSINISYPYIMTVVLAASIANVRTPGFYNALFILGVWALFSVRSRRLPFLFWVMIVIFAGFSGYAGHIGLHRLQVFIEDKGMDWYMNAMRGTADPFKSITAIGDIGTLKLGNRVIFRVESPDRKLENLLVREASYNRYILSNWFVTSASFKLSTPEADKQTWHISPERENSSYIKIYSYLGERKDVLKLPGGSFKVTQLPVSSLEISPFGAVRIENGPSMIGYGVYYNPDYFTDSAPDTSDLVIPKKEIPAVVKIVRQLDLGSKTNDQILETIHDFFQNNFKYSLQLENKYEEITPVSEFLLNLRSGHCEYFATSTVLLLRGIGIPARYATGYLVYEYSKLNKAYIVRESHAHAWAIAFINGKWQDIDNTPAGWPEFDTADAENSLWEVFFDFFSWMRFAFSKSKEQQGGIKNYALLLLIPLFIILARRLSFRRSVTRHRKKQAIETSTLEKRNGSGFYSIEKYMESKGFYRLTHEPLLFWTDRIKSGKQLPTEAIEALEFLIHLHYRNIFGHENITNKDLQNFDAKVRLWLKTYRSVI